LRNKDHIIDASLKLIRENKETALTFFRKYSKLFTWFEPAGSSVAFPRLNEKIPVSGFCKNLFETKSVLLMPAGMFGSNENHFRIGLGKKRFREALGQLESFVNENYMN
jgi:aspartate/methionine/tyrosine aminotransferase